MTFDDLAAELAGAPFALAAALAAEGEQLAEEGRGLAALNAAARVYGPRSGRGTLQASIRGRSAATAEAVAVEWTAGEAGTPAADYARAQELGATIRPVRARFLAIPTDRAARLGLTSIRDLAERRLVPRRGGGWLVLGRRGKACYSCSTPAPSRCQPNATLATPSMTWCASFPTASPSPACSGWSPQHEP
jgi:hypothetical protein